MVVRVCAPSDNELRMMGPSAINGTKALTGDDDFVTVHDNDWASLFFQSSQPRELGAKR
jgi:hypothetical protein